MGIMRVSMGVSALLVLALTEVPKLYPESGFVVVFWIFMALQIVGFIYPIHGLAFQGQKSTSKNVDEQVTELIKK